MTESNRVTAELLIAIPERWPHIRCWRSNSGSGVGMEQVKQAVRLMQAGNVKGAIDALQRPVKFGLVGMADISGIIGPNGKLFQLEIKIKDKQSEQQKNWQEVCCSLGVPYGIAHSKDEGMRWLEGYV